MLSYYKFVVTSLFVSSLGMLYMYGIVHSEGVGYLVEFMFSSLSSVDMVLSFYFDWMSFLFSFFVSVISMSVAYYSIEYMDGDRRAVSFLKLVMLFVVSMLLVIFSLNLVSIMLGWDGLGLTSYLLVIYYQNDKSLSAGMITALSNRVGDVAILLGVGLAVELGGWEFMSLVKGEEDFSKMVMGFIILAAMTKSAQIPFSAWLPEAMAAPTPVSSLVHSSTLVTAGVYLLVRFSPILSSLGLHEYLFYLGGSTMLMASLSANLETDMKKVVALSTLSQLGLMMISLSLGMFEITIFHLLAHACFKALLFLGSGKVIHESMFSQDLRRMGGLSDSLSFTTMSMSVSNLALCGFPFLAGFYSKDLIIESSWMSSFSFFFFSVMGAGVGLSASYSVRFVVSSLLKSSGQASCNSSFEGLSAMVKSNLVLLSLTVTGGAMVSWLIVKDLSLIFLPFMLKLVVLMSLGLGLSLGGLLSYSSFAVFSYSGNLMFSFLSSMWFLSGFSGGVSTKMGAQVSQVFGKWDLLWHEYFIYSVNLSKGMSNFVSPLMKYQTKVVQDYMTFFVLLTFLVGFLGSK